MRSIAGPSPNPTSSRSYGSRLLALAFAPADKLADSVWLTEQGLLVPQSIHIKDEPAKKTKVFDVEGNNLDRPRFRIEDGLQPAALFLSEQAMSVSAAKSIGAISIAAPSPTRPQAWRMDSSSKDQIGKRRRQEEKIDKR